jgi:hypothetical protein
MLGMLWGAGAMGSYRTSRKVCAVSPGKLFAPALWFPAGHTCVPITSNCAITLQRAEGGAPERDTREDEGFRKGPETSQ